MTRKPRRIIEEAIFEHLGPLSARELIAMPREGWEHLRAGITDSRNGKQGLSARCVACGGPVYITTATGLPLFAHYQGSDPRCPWYSGKNMHPDDVRAAQYHGQQESEMHRRMCELIAELAALDDRCISVKVDAYLPPEKNERGRFPDVLVDWRDIGAFAVEYQMSHTFQTEVSQRCIHYDREGLPLLWVLSSLDPNRVPQPVSDVVHRHRGNAFVLDQAAVNASREQRTLVLSCYMSNGAGYDPPVLVRFDALTFPESKRPYLEDRIAKPLLDQINARRLPYFRALRAWGDRMADLPLDDLEVFEERHREAAGKPENFASEHDNIKGMMNTYQNSGTLAPYARLLTVLIENTSQRSLLKGTVGQHLQKSISSHRFGHIEQVDEKSPEWLLLRELLPEALNPFDRQRLKDAGALPGWAT
jgi:hypothetical protein